MIPFCRGTSNAGPLQDAWSEHCRARTATPQSIALRKLGAALHSAQELGQIAGSAPASSGQPDRLP